MGLGHAALGASEVTVVINKKRGMSAFMVCTAQRHSRGLGGHLNYLSHSVAFPVTSFSQISHIKETPVYIAKHSLAFTVSPHHWQLLYSVEKEPEASGIGDFRPSF